MYGKGNVRRVGNQKNFWGRKAKKISSELKEFVYEQYFSMNSLFVYCDASMHKKGIQMATACSFVKDGSVIVESSWIYPPAACYRKNVYGELQAILYALLHVNKHMGNPCDNITIYSDVNNIKGILEGTTTFKKNHALQQIQKDLQHTYKTISASHPQINLSIEYLTVDKKMYNPFAKSAHNAAKKLIQF
ncbi:ribonuclease H family protein [Oceanobacillus halotolerans]|uniref:hypothetical protein n=1 Tax=Oceanobacillus halotolerans TaxID=2663380 RepID=UPI0013D95694|nr:hypothetical protein [Oceanobacillus halotolerans]